MKKLFLFACIALISGFGFSQTTATNFTVNDCAGASHNLFTELESGKVVVLVWVMPCATCINPSKTAYDAVQGYATSNPGKVLMYLCDDDGSTTCSSINTWAAQNAMPNSIKFSNSSILMTDYGNEGMPKIVVLGGWGHTVFYNEIDGANLSGIQPAINQALIASGINDNNNIIPELNIYPNKIKNSATLIYSLIQPVSVNIEIFDITGKGIKTFYFANQVQGKHETQIDFSAFCNGIYFLKINTGGFSKTVKFTIVH